MRMRMEDNGGGEGEVWRKSCTGRECTDGVRSGSGRDCSSALTLACPPY